ncbi:MAG TPA: carbamoyltransferase [Rhodospirillales bacterium]|nr:carbamoyltransferase [Rhodospirillales bacterium]
MIVLGLKCFSHDTGAAILSDHEGKLKVVAISEARLNRRKHSFAYPLMSIAYCLASLGLDSLDDVDLICIDRHMEIWPDRNSQFGYQNALKRYQPRYDDNHRWNYLIEQSIKFDQSKCRLINHIDAHAASAYFASPFNDAAVLIAEGGTGIYHGQGSNLKIIDRIGYLGATLQNGKKLAERRDHFVNSSFFYDKISAHLGYDIFGAGQTMALAGFAHQFPYEPLINIDPHRYDDFIINHNKTVFSMKDIPTFKSQHSEKLISNPWISLAYQAQKTLEDDILYLARLAQKKTGAKKICLAGGAALNCIINKKLIESGVFDEIFVQPAASDEGIALGCALSGYYSNGGYVRHHMSDAYLGQKNEPRTLSVVIEKWKLKATKTSTQEIARLLADGKIIGRVADRSEYGPRALGNRSILADPRRSNMKDRLNTKIKHRESFRPFAPSCLEDKIPDYFNSPAKSPFMVIAGTVNENSRNKVPAVTHTDGSCRVQTVNREQNSDYYDLIEAFGDITGCPVLTNTSFNDRAEPIVETYEDAANCFLRTGLDALYCDGILVQRTEKTPTLTSEQNLQNTIARVNSEYTNIIDRFCNVSAYVSLANELNKNE